MKFEYPNHQALFDYWQSIRDNGKLPTRKGFLPEKIHRLLGDLIIMQWNGMKDVSYALVGNKVHQRMGVNLTGTNFFEVAPPEMHDYYAGMFHAVVSTPVGMRVDVQTRGSHGRLNKISCLSLPLADEDGQVDRIVTMNHPIDTSSFLVEDGISVAFEAEDPEYIDIGFGLPKTDG